MSYGEHDGMAGDMDPDPSYGGGHAFDCNCGSCYPRGESVTSYSPSPMFVFYSERELVESAVFKRCLDQSLAFKQQQIDDLRRELIAGWPV